MRRIVVVGVALLTAGLVGCGDGSVARDTYPGLPRGADEAEAEEHLRAPVPMLTWLEGGDAVAITTWGSSSCPPVAVEIESDRDSITVEFEDSDDEVCTADLGPTTHEFDVPGNVADDPAVSALFRSGETEQTYTLAE